MTTTYNLTPSTYDGRHNKMTTDQFRDYIQKSVESLKEQYHPTTIKETPSVEDKRKIHSEKVKHYVEEETVFRCGWCGNIVDSKGKELNQQDRMYAIKVLEKYGDSVAKAVHGKCCESKYR
jgi:hypothetical protein